jgi:hypothetical protein
MYISKKWMRTALAAVLAAALALSLAACSGTDNRETEPTYPDFGASDETMPQTQPPVQIEMPEYELTYSGEFRDLIVTEQREDGLVFTVKLSRTEAEIFTLLYNTDEGDLVTVMEDAKGNRISVAFRMAALPENLNEQDTQLFFSAQEAVNEIVASLVLK